MKQQIFDAVILIILVITIIIGYSINGTKIKKLKNELNNLQQKYEQCKLEKKANL